MKKYYILFIIFIILTSISLPARVEGNNDHKYYSYSARKSKSTFSYKKKKSNTHNVNINLSCGTMIGLIVCLVIITLLKHFLQSRK